MIAITAHTELQQVQTVTAEPQKIYEPEEDSPDEFASLLAGLLHKNELPEIPEVSLDETSDFGIDFSDLTGGKEIAFGNSAVNEDFSNAGFLEEQFGDLLNLNNRFAASDETQTDFLNEMPDMNIPSMDMSGLESLVMDTSGAKQTKNQDTLKEAGQKTDFSIGKKEDAAIEEAIAANMKDVLKQFNEKSSSESVNKRDRVINENALSKNNKTEMSAFASGSRSEEAASLQKKPEIDSRAVMNETRSRSRRDRLNIEVRDMRTAESTGNQQTRTFTSVEAAVGRVSGEAPVREITLDLRLPDYNSGSASQNTMQTAWETKAGASLESMLARELHQSFNGDIVRHASMALRDGGSGTIKLALHPETLGNVKIQLEMTDNKITGHIVVESAEALNAFRKELSALEQAFRDSGYENADLNLSLAADANTEGQRQEGDSFTPQMIATRYENSFDADGEYGGTQTVNVYLERKNGSVNILA